MNICEINTHSVIRGGCTSANILSCRMGMSAGVLAHPGSDVVSRVTKVVCSIGIQLRHVQLNGTSSRATFQ